MDVDGDDEEVIDKSSREYQSQFGLPEDELVRDYFNCALQKGILHQGKMYISQHYLCFYSNILLSEAKVVIRADKISTVEPAKILIFSTAIRVTTNDGSEYLFASFLQRDQALHMIEKIMRGERIGKQRVKLPSELDSQAASSSRSRPSAAIDKPKHLQLLEEREKKIKASKNEEANAVKSKDNDRGSARNKGISSSSSSRKNSEDLEASSAMPKSKPTAASAKKKGKGELVFEEEVDHEDSASDDKRRRSLDDDDDNDDDRPRKGKSTKAEDRFAKDKKKSRRQVDDDDDDPMHDDDDDRQRRRRRSDSDDRRRPRREGEEEEEDDDRTPPRRKNKNGGSARKRRDDDSDDTRDSRDVSEDDTEREMRLEREEREARKQKKPTGKSSEPDLKSKKPPLHPVERSQSRSNQTATPSRSPLATPQRTPDVSDDERGPTKKKTSSNTLKPPSGSPSLKPAKPSSAPGSAAASDLESDAEYEMRRTRRQAAVLDDETRQVNSEFKRFSCSIFDPFTTYKLPDPRVTKINSRFKGLSQSLDTRNRRLIYEGFIKRQGKFSVVDRWCFLFTDCLIFAEIIPPEEGKSGEQMYKLKQMIELSKMHIDARPVDQQKASNTAPSSSSSSSSGGVAALKEQANAAWENEAFGSGFDLIKSTKIPNPIRIISHVPENVTYVVGFTNRIERLRWLDWLQFAIARNMRAMKSPYIFAPGSSNTQAEGWWLRIVKGSVHRAAFEGDVTSLSSILKNDPSLLNSTLDLADGFTPLHYAVQANRVEALEFLCSFPDVDLRECDTQNNTPIHLAVRLGRIECLQLLLAECAKRSIDYTVFHPIPYSTKQLTVDFSLRGKNLREMSAVWSCALSSHRDWAIMFRMLIKFVKDHKPQHHHHHHYMQSSYSILNERDQQGHTLLEECVLGGLEELLPVLIQNGAAIDLPNSDGLTPLGLSASFSNEPFVRFLLQLGAQPNIRSKPSLQAPGHQCVDRSTALLLIKNGARYRMASADGKKLVDLFDEDDEKQQEQLDEAIEASENSRPILITKQKLYIPASNLAFQGMAACEICCDEFSKTSSHRKKELCGKCNKVICAACSSPKLAFPVTKVVAKARPVPIQLPSTSAAGGSAAFAPIAKKDAKNEIARVCDGCYNSLYYHTINVRKETARLEIERERRKKAAAERLAKHGGKIPTKNPSSASAKKKQSEKEKKEKKSSKGKGKKRRDTDDDDDDDDSHTDSDEDEDDASDIECNSSTTTSGSDDEEELSELNDELELDEGDIYRGPEARRDNPSNSAAAIASKAVISATTGLLGLVGVNIKPSKHGGDEERGGLVESATGALNKLGSMLTSVHVSQARKSNAREISTAHGTIVINDGKTVSLPDGARFRHVRAGSLAQNGMDGPAMAMRAGAVPIDGSPLPRRSPTLTPASGARTVPNLTTRSNNSSPAPRDHDDEPENHKRSSGGGSGAGMVALAFKPRRKSMRGRRVDDDVDDAEEEEEEERANTKSSRAAAASKKSHRKSRGDTDDDDDDDA